MQGRTQTENFHLIGDEYGNSAGIDSALPYLQKEIPAWEPDFALAGEEKEKNNLHLHRPQFKVIYQQNWKTLKDITSAPLFPQTPPTLSSENR